MQNATGEGRDVFDMHLLDRELAPAMPGDMMRMLVSGVAHEVRNPLNGMLAVMEALLLEVGERRELMEYKKHIIAQAARLTSLTENLQLLAQPVKTKDCRPVTVEELASAWIMPRRKARSRSAIRINVHIDATAASRFVRVDMHKLNCVAAHLLENAAHHSSPGAIVELRVLPPHNRRITLCIADSGSGVVPRYLERIFEPFFSTRTGGTGLGLSIVKHIVESHGGTVTAHNNKPEPGLTVVVELPEVKKNGTME